MLPRQSTVVWSIIISILHVVAILSTLFRICHRGYKRQMWYDDYIAVIPLVADCVYFIIFWMAMVSKDYLRYRNNQHFFTSFMFGLIVNMTVLWFSRISLALSLARIFPQGHVARRLSLCISGFCFLFFCITIALTIGLCQGGGRPWYRLDPHYCRKGPKKIPVNGIVAVLGDILADTLLFLAPLFVLRRVKLPVNQRRMISAAFSGSILTLLSAIIFAVFWYCRIKIGASKVVLRFVVASIESTISLIVCNLLVVTMFFYRIFRRIHNIEAPEPNAAAAAKQQQPIPLQTPASGSRTDTGDEEEDEDSSGLEDSTQSRSTSRPNCATTFDSGSSGMAPMMTFTQIETAGGVWDSVELSMPPEETVSKSAVDSDALELASRKQDTCEVDIGIRDPEASTELATMDSHS